MFSEGTIWLLHWVQLCSYNSVPWSYNRLLCTYTGLLCTYSGPLCTYSGLLCYYISSCFGLILFHFFPPLLFLLFLHKHFICFYMSLKIINCQNKQYFLLLICMSILKYSLGLLWIYLGFCHASDHCRSLNFLTWFQALLSHFP